MPTCPRGADTGKGLPFRVMGLFARKNNDVKPIEASGTPRIPSLGNGVTVPLTLEDFPPILESLRVTAPPDPIDGLYTDWMGVHTRVSMLPWAPAELASTISSELPIPDDGYRSEAEEYVALSLALTRATEDFHIIEVGAGWAPWVVSGVVPARARGLNASGIAIEAHPLHAQWAMQHAADNNVDAELIEGTSEMILGRVRESQATMKVILGAGWHESTTMEFPDIDGTDMGAALCTMPDSGTDYRGAHVKHRIVQALKLSELFDAMPQSRIDLLHIDVQGVEFELLNKEAGPVQDHAALMAVGTHSRLAEGQLQDFFLERGWGIIIDEPCKAHFTMTHPTLAGFTVKDGFQLYENPFLLTQ